MESNIHWRNRDRLTSNQSVDIPIASAHAASDEECRFAHILSCVQSLIFSSVAVRRLLPTEHTKYIQTKAEAHPVPWLPDHLPLPL